MDNTVLFDGDVLLYMAGFAVEKRFYRVIDLSDIEDGEQYLLPLSTQFQYKKDAIKEVELLLRKGSGSSVQIDFEVEAKEFKHAEGALKAVIRRTLKDCHTDKYKIILSDLDSSNIFRYKIYDEYKANRKGNIKPQHHKELLESMLTDKYGEVIVSKGIEADDELGILMNEKDTICASIDKDLLMIPGKHYNITSGKKLIATDPGEIYIEERASGKKDLKGFGLKWFFAQMLLGDAVDNIHGIPRCGPVKVMQLLGKVESPEQMKDIVHQEYGKTDLDYELNRQLLWILRERL
jgi:5'-3' exonuclease